MSAGFLALRPPRGGNCVNRDSTRRRHAAAMRLMVQNPHPPRARSMARSTILPTALPTALHGVSRSLPRPEGGIASIGTRHAAAMRLMVQNPHPHRVRPMARSTILPTALPTVPHGVPHSPPHGAPHRAPRGSPLSSPPRSPPRSPQPSTGEGAAPGCAPASSIIRGISRKYLTCVGRG